MSRLPLLALLLSPAPAFACAGFFHEPGELAESSYEEAVFQKGDGWVEVQYKVDLTVDTPDFGWVIPVPGEFQSFGDGDSQLFSDLFTATAPTFDLEQPASSGCGMASKGDANFTSEGDVTVLYQGSTPTYDYTVINADSSDALMTWLSDNGWDPGETAASITDYVNEGGWQFVAVKTHMDAETDSVKTTLPPVKIRYAGDRIQYPARMGRYAQGDSLSSIVYVLGDQKARISGGWDQVDLPEVGDEGENPDYMQYEAYPERIAEIGSEGAYARTYADVYQSGWVTRFDTTSPVELNTVDVEFAVDDGTEAMHLVVTNKGPSACATSSGARSLGWLPLLALLWRRRR